MEMASVSDDVIYEVRQGLRPTSATRRVDWPEDHACGCNGKNSGGKKEMENSQTGDQTLTDKLGVYMLYTTE